MNISHFILSISAAVAITASVASCSGKNEWTVNGKIEGAEGQEMLLEGSDNGRWFVIDTIHINEAGQFKATHAASGYPDIYRLRLGDKTLYFPIDSIETVTVVTKADAFDHEYTISGSPSADMLMAVDKKVMDAASRNGGLISADTALKRELGGLLLNDPSGIVSYYIINKRVQGVPLFNPADKKDIRVIGAVANAYNQYRPNDPRTRYLTNLYLSNRTVKGGDTIQAGEIRILDINLFDKNGKQRSLKQVASANKVVLLNFTAYGAEFSPALNVELNKVYEKYKNQGFEIYQVNADGEEYQWKQTAKNLPWVSVFCSPVDTKPLVDYNVQALPAGFIIANGEITDRVDDTANIDALVRKHL